MSLRYLTLQASSLFNISIEKIGSTQARNTPLPFCVNAKTAGGSEAIDSINTT